MEPTKKIIVSILENKFEAFVARLATIENIVPLVEIDVMDGIFVNNKSFSDIERLNELNPKCKFQLHLMVDDSLAEIKKWKNIKNISSVIFHIESKSDPRECIELIKKNGWQAGIALKPETTLATVKPYYNLVDTIMFMLVNPGNQGGQLVAEVSEKIKQFVAIKDRPLCATDGATNQDTIQLIKSWGVEIFGIGSAIIKSGNPAQFYLKFLTTIQQ